MSSKTNIKYRDSLFRAYFNEPIRLLSLCNAILGTDYKDTKLLNINTLEGIFFDEQKNDISCSIDDQFLILLEHQSTVNNNMPLRCLSYVAELLNKLIKDKRELYREALIKFPAPKFFVLYNGEKDEPSKKEMRLSDAFNGVSTSDSASLELIITAYNINYGLEQPLLKKCKYLDDYSCLVAKVKEGIVSGMPLKDAISNAVKFCIANGIMREYLEFHSEEVFNMLTLQWDKDLAMKARFDDGFNNGFNNGVESIALKMLNRGKSYEDIKADTDLSMERIKELAVSVNR